jgi:hypothetical protein
VLLALPAPLEWQELLVLTVQQVPRVLALLAPPVFKVPQAFKVQLDQLALV